jgi:GT2 family glycosyltransferase
VQRPSVSVIVPFAGTDAELDRVIETLKSLELRAGDEILVADNRDTPRAGRHQGVRVIDASGIRTPAFARNMAASHAQGDWLVFIDADTEPASSLLDGYFSQPPPPRCGVLAGRIVDVAPSTSATARHGVARARLSESATVQRDGRPYAQTANCAVRRSAFDHVGGFVPYARAGEDADLCFRLADAGFTLELRSGAVVRHRSRDSVAQYALQLARHGSGAAWVNRRHAGACPPPSPARMARRVARNAADALGAVRAHDNQAAAFAALDALGALAFELGRLLPNRRRERRLRRRVTG